MSVGWHETGSGLGEAFMQQSAAGRAEYRAKKGKQSAASDPLTVLMHHYYRGEMRKISTRRLREYEQHLMRRLCVLAQLRVDSPELTRVPLQQRLLRRWWHRAVEELSSRQ